MTDAGGRGGAGRGEPAVSNGTAPGRRIIVLFAIALVVGAAIMLLFSQASSLLERGTEAPSFELLTLAEGEAVSLSSLRGKVVVIDFWSTSCPPCVRQMGVLEALHRNLADRDLVVLGINTEGAPPSLLRRFVAEHGGASYPILLDGAAVSERYRVTALPSLYVIDREGSIRWTRVGFAPLEDLEQAVGALLPGGSGGG